MRWMLVACWLAGACGDDGSSPAVDAPGSDATGDAPIGDPNAITVYFYPVAALPIDDVPVDFVAPDGTRTTVLTDDTGMAKAPAVPGTAAIVHWTAQDRTFVTSYAALEPGDVVIVGEPRGTPKLGDIEVAFPSQGAGFTTIEVSCKNAIAVIDATTYRVSIDDCPNVSSGTIAVLHYTSPSAPDGISTLTDLDLKSLVGTRVTLPAFTTMPTTVTNAITNIPAGVTQIDWGASYLDADGIEPMSTMRPAQAPLPIDPTETLTGMLMPVGTRTTSRTNFAVGATGARYIQALDGQATAIAVDAATMTKPITEHATYDPGSQRFAWTEAAIGRAPDTVVLKTMYMRGAQTVHLVAYAPYGGAPMLALPPLPLEIAPDAALADVRVTTYAADGVGYRPFVLELDGLVASSYALRGVSYWISASPN